MSQKKTLEEQIAALSAGRADWLEPFQKWILTAKNAGEIAVSGSLQEKRVLALEVFGSNLVLDGKKAVVLVSNRGRHSSNLIKWWNGGHYRIRTSQTGTKIKENQSMTHKETHKN
jgi:multimeric flavodoxin WrbA